MQITVAFLILNYKSFQDTIRVTREVLDFNQKDFHVVIVDNASPNESLEELNKAFRCTPSVTIIQNSTNSGYAKGNNVGLKFLKKLNPMYVCIINNDVHFTLQTIRNLCEWYKMLPNPAVISPIQKNPTGEIASFLTLDIPTLLYDIKTYTILFQPVKHRYYQNTKIKGVQEVGIVPGAFLFINYKLFESLDFFDEETFLFCEERFLGRKIERNNLKNYIILNEDYVHEHSKTINQESSQNMQQEYLFEGKIKYWKRYSKTPMIVFLLLSTMRMLNNFEIKFLKRLKTFFK